jgi:putative oxidoreductase
MCAVFAESGFDKLMNFGFYVAEAGTHHIPLPTLAIAGAAMVEMAGCIAILTGFALTPALLALAAYTVIVNFFYFDFWNMSLPAAVGARKEFLKNLAVAAGILAYLAWAR